MITTRQAERRQQALRAHLLEPGGSEAEVLEPPLHLRAGQGLVAEFAHGRAQRLRGEQAAQHAPHPRRRADILFRPRPLAPGIDVLEYLLDEREVGLPMPYQFAQMKPMAASPAGIISCSVQVASGPTILSRGTPTWAASFRAVVVMTPTVRRMTQSGWATLTRSQVAFWSSPGVWHGQVLHRKAVVGGLGVEDGEGFPALVVIPVDMGDFQALELVHAADPLADEANLGGVLTPVVGRGGEDIRKHPPIRGVRAPSARREQGDPVARGPLHQGIDERGAEQRKRRRSRRPLGFQALVALHAAGDIVDGLALFPDQCARH